jgi:hypothetical protein
MDTTMARREFYDWNKDKEVLIRTMDRREFDVLFDAVTRLLEDNNFSRKLADVHFTVFVIKVMDKMVYVNLN